MTTYIRSIPEYRVVVPGRAISFRSPHANAYKKLIRSIAQRIFSQPLSNQIIDIRIDYFHTSRRRVDIDNVAKCVIDALNGVAYVDDRYVRFQAATAYRLQVPVRIQGGPVDLIKPLAQHDEYLFIRIRGHS